MLDPKHPRQSFRSWVSSSTRDKPASTRDVIYVVAAPEIAPFMNAWTIPQPSMSATQESRDSGAELDPPAIGQFIEYIRAFYHGLAVRQLPRRLHFVPLDENYGLLGGKRQKNVPEFIGLAVEDDGVRIRVSPPSDGMFKAQLNLNDILDAASEMLPSDAYAILLLMNHDMYEDEADNFCCGRAYGGSRISVVSTARYHPILDGRAGIDHMHMWPTSRCAKYTRHLFGESLALQQQQSHNPTTAIAAESAGPMRQAVDACSRVQSSDSMKYPQGLWHESLALQSMN